MDTVYVRTHSAQMRMAIFGAALDTIIYFHLGTYIGTRIRLYSHGQQPGTSMRCFNFGKSFSLFPSSFPIFQCENFVNKDELRILVILLRNGINKFIIEVNLLFSVIEIDPNAHHSNFWKSPFRPIVCKMLDATSDRLFSDERNDRKEYTLRKRHFPSVLFNWWFLSLGSSSGSSLPKSIER